MRFLFITLVSLALCAQVHAAEYTTNTCLDVFNALSSLDGYERDGKKMPYKFSIATRLAIARNLSMLRDIKTAWETQNNALIVQLTDGSGRWSDDLAKKTEQLGKFNVEIMKSSAAKHDLTFAKIKISDLMCGKPKCDDVAEADLNPIPPSTISQLMILLED